MVTGRSWRLADSSSLYMPGTKILGVGRVSDEACSYVIRMRAGQDESSRSRFHNCDSASKVALCSNLHCTVREFNFC